MLRLVHAGPENCDKVSVTFNKCLCTTCNAGYWSADGGKACIPDPWAPACAASSVGIVLYDTGAPPGAYGLIDGQLGRYVAAYYYRFAPFVTYKYAASQSFVALGTYSHVTIQGWIGYDIWGTDLTWDFYLSTAVGPDATAADLVASVSFVVPASQVQESVDLGAVPDVPTIMFQDVSITEGTTYYVTAYAKGFSLFDLPGWYSAPVDSVDGIKAYAAGPYFFPVEVDVNAEWKTDFPNSPTDIVVGMAVTACNAAC